MCFNMCAWCRYTRGRCGRTHTTPHRTPHHNTTWHTTPHRTTAKTTTHYPLPATRYPQHTTTQEDKERRQRKREGERRERRQKKREERGETRRDETRRDETRRDETRRDKTRQDERREEARQEKRQDKKRDKMKMREEERQEKRQDEDERGDRERERRQDQEETQDEKEDRREKMKKKREDERDNEEREMKRGDLNKKCFRTLKSARWISPKCFEKKKIPSGRIIPPFFLRKCRIWPFLNYLHDSNSIFRARGINSEWVFGRTVVELTALVANRATRSLCSSTKLVNAGYSIEMRPTQFVFLRSGGSCILLQSIRVRKSCEINAITSSSLKR